ncbi:hypothetical protein pb186bvf_019082 [Paramecium bursaria]
MIWVFNLFDQCPKFTDTGKDNHKIINIYSQYVISNYSNPNFNQFQYGICKVFILEKNQYAFHISQAINPILTDILQ